MREDRGILFASGALIVHLDIEEDILTVQKTPESIFDCHW